MDTNGSRYSWLCNVELLWLGCGIGDGVSAGRSGGEVIRVNKEEKSAEMQTNYNIHHRVLKIFPHYGYVSIVVMVEI